MANNVLLNRSTIFLYIFLIILPMKSSETSESEALLELKKSFSNATALDSWKAGTEPCNRKDHWIGVICESNGVVSTLRLGNLGLSGKINVGALSLLSGLRSISFASNGFSGPIPDFHRLGALKGIYLSENQFSGEIPSDYFKQMEGLKKLWLSKNKFSGPIPSSLVGLSHLMELHLEDNQFSGTIPPLNPQGLVSLDLSNNNLEGEIPQSLSRFGVSTFEGNSGICGGNTGKVCHPSVKSMPSVWLVAGTIIVCSLAIIAVLVIMKQRRDNLNDMSINDSISFSESSTGKKDFDSHNQDLNTTHRLTSSRSKASSRSGRKPADIVMINEHKAVFGLADLMKSSAEVLGSGVLGSSYRATMANGTTVVVKRVKEMNKMGRDEFDAAMRMFGRLSHVNVLVPVAYHYRKDEKLLVFEYQPKGNLFNLLHGDRGLARAELKWPVRLKIIRGIAGGLDYLHKELSSLDLPHGNLKSSNVLMTLEHEPLLVDFGFCSLISFSQAAQTLTAYKSPEALAYQQISPKCDAYCLGLVILEILTGQLPSQFVRSGEGGMDLVPWLRSAIEEGREVELVDGDIAGAENCATEMVQILHIAAACLENRPEQRLDVREASKRIENVRAEGIYQDMTPLLL